MSSVPDVCTHSNALSSQPGRDEANMFSPTQESGSENDSMFSLTQFPRRLCDGDSGIGFAVPCKLMFELVSDFVSDGASVRGMRLHCCMHGASSATDDRAHSVLFS